MAPVVKWYGRAGHFCAAYNCQFHLHTHVGKYCISTVGEYHPNGPHGKMETLGAGKNDFYETMVFEHDELTGDNGSELHCQRFGSLQAAEAYHMDLINEYMNKENK